MGISRKKIDALFKKIVFYRTAFLFAAIFGVSIFYYFPIYSSFSRSALKSFPGSFIRGTQKVQAATGTPQQPMTYIPFDGNANATIFPTGTNGTPTLNRTPTYTTGGIVGQAMLTPGIGGRTVTYNGKYAIPEKGTLTFWMKGGAWTDGDGKWADIFELGPMTGHTDGSGSLILQNQYPTGYSAYQLYSFGIDFNKWSQVGITWMGNVVNVYIDGAFKSQFLMRAPFTATDANYLALDDGYSGAKTLFDELYIYDYPLSKGEMTQVYNSYFDGSTAHLPMTSDAKLSVAHYPAVYKVQAMVDLTHNNYGGAASKATIIATDSTGKSFTLGDLVNFGTEMDKGLFDLPQDVAAGQVSITATIKNSSGAALDTLVSDSFQKQKFFWEGSTAGESDQVIAPFTPIQANGKTYSVWGRDYTLSDSGFPTAITSRSASILAAPVTLHGTNDHGSLSFSPSGTLQTVSSSPGKVVLKGTSTADGGRVTVENSIDLEYDGMMKYTMKITPDPAGVNFTNLYLDIPINEANAKLYEAADEDIRGSNQSNYVPAGTGSVWKSTSMKNNNLPVLGSFIPYFWLGDYDRGLSWMADSDKGWISSDSNPEIEFIRQNGQVIARLNLFNMQKNINQPREIVFALEASPARPEPDGWRGYKKFSNWWGGDEQGVFEGYSRPPDVQYFINQSLVLKARGTAVAPNYSPSDWWDTRFHTSENQYFKMDWLSGTVFGNTIEQRNSCQAEYTKRFMAGGDINGITSAGGYLNGLYVDDTMPSSTWNTVSGNAYVRDTDGRVQVGYNLFAQRDFYKRLANIFRDNNGSNSMMVHMTDAMIVPAYSFFDLKLDNEGNGDTSNPIEGFPLGDIVARTMSRQYGMGAHWHTPRGWDSSYNPDRINGGADLGALLLLHDILGRSDAYDERIGYARKMFDVGASDVEFMGYWVLQPDKNPADKNDGPKMSALVRKPEKTAFITVANLTTSDWTGDVSIPLAQLGLDSSSVFSDGEYPYTRQNLSGSNTIHLSIPAHNFRVILAGPTGTFPVDFVTTLEKPGNVVFADNFDAPTLDPAWTMTCGATDCSTHGQIQAYRGTLHVESYGGAGGNANQLNARHPFTEDNVSVQVRVHRVGTGNDAQGLSISWASGNSVFAGPNFSFKQFQFATWKSSTQSWSQALAGVTNSNSELNWVRIDLQSDKILFYGSSDGKTWVKGWEVIRGTDFAGPPSSISLGKGVWNQIYFDDLIAGRFFNADLNADSKVDTTDLNILNSDFLKLTANLTNPKSDINYDGQCTIRDAGIMMSQWKP